jgi:biopolymer transport protein ExbD
MHGPGGDHRADPNLTPLLDVVLQLIMFFMITVNFVRVDQVNEEVNLPVAQAAVPMEKTADSFVFLNINKDGRLIGTLESLNGGRRLEEYLKTLMTHLERKAQLQGQKEPKLVMVLRADKDARYRDIWEYLDIGKVCGIKHFQFRALKKQN